MVQYTLYVPNNHNLISLLYKRFLVDDKVWHFFYEDFYMLLRLERRNEGVEGCLRKKGIKFDFVKYEDPHSMVRKYQEVFIPIFHGYAMLAMRSKKKEVYEVAERVVHCYANICSALLSIPESRLISWVALHRAQNEGYVYAKKEFEDKVGVPRL